MAPNDSASPRPFPLWMQSVLTVDRVRAALENGRGNMPAFPQLSKEEMADLAAFVMSSDQSWKDITASGMIKYSS